MTSNLFHPSVVSPNANGDYSQQQVRYVDVKQSQETSLREATTNNRNIIQSRGNMRCYQNYRANDLPKDLLILPSQKKDIINRNNQGLTNTVKQNCSFFNKRNNQKVIIQPVQIKKKHRVSNHNMVMKGDNLKYSDRGQSRGHFTQTQNTLITTNATEADQSYKDTANHSPSASFD